MFSVLQMYTVISWNFQSTWTPLCPNQAWRRTNTLLVESTAPPRPETLTLGGWGSWTLSSENEWKMLWLSENRQAQKHCHRTDGMLSKSKLKHSGFQWPMMSLKALKEPRTNKYLCPLDAPEEGLKWIYQEPVACICSISTRECWSQHLNEWWHSTLISTFKACALTTRVTVKTVIKRKGWNRMEGESVGWLLYTESYHCSSW